MISILGIVLLCGVLGLVVLSVMPKAAEPGSLPLETGAPTAPVSYTYVVIRTGVPLATPQIQQLFNALEVARLAYNLRADVPAYRRGNTLDTYVYQFVPRQNEAGDTVVTVYGLPPASQANPGWETTPMDVSDGGAVYFDATVLLPAGVVSDFFVHGEA